jgi:hypothetical protein
VHTQHPYWALAAVCLTVLAITLAVLGVGITFWALQKWQDFRTALIDRKLAQLELAHCQAAHDQARQ